jgi:hypothetical protein
LIATLPPGTVRRRGAKGLSFGSFDVGQILAIIKLIMAIVEQVNGNKGAEAPAESPRPDGDT